MAWWRRRQSDPAWRAAGERAGSGKATSRSRRASGTLRGTSGASRSGSRGRAPPQRLPSQLGQERVGQQRQGDMAMPAIPAADLILVQSRLAFALLEALLDRPARTGDAGQRAERRLWRSVAQVVGLLGGVADGATNQQPAFRTGPAAFPDRHAHRRPVVDPRPFGA